MVKGGKKKKGGEVTHIGLPESIYIDRRREQKLFKKGLGAKSIRGSAAVFYWLARGTLAEQLRAGKISRAEWKAQHKKLFQAVKKRHPILMRAGEVVSPVFAHDYVGPTWARAALGPLWFMQKPAIDSEPIHFIEEGGRQWAVGRTHWALFRRPLKGGEAVIYPATSGHGPKVVKGKKAKGYEEVPTEGMFQMDMEDFARHARGYLGEPEKPGMARPFPFQTEAASKIAMKRADKAIGRLHQEIDELPTWAGRSKGLYLWTPLGRTRFSELRKMLRP